MKVLIVEDHRITARVVENIVKMIGHEVIATVDTGEEAVKKAKKLEPDIVLCDVQLAGKMNGIEAAKLITPIPVIFLTANPDRPDLKPYVCLKKRGFKMDDLRKAIEKVRKEKK